MPAKPKEKEKSVAAADQDDDEEEDKHSVRIEMSTGASSTAASNDSNDGYTSYAYIPRQCCLDTAKTATGVSASLADTAAAGNKTIESQLVDEIDGRRKRTGGGGGSGSGDTHSNYAGNKNVAEGLMDLALLSANANQLRFLLTYNHEASTYYISLGLIALSLTVQVAVGIALIFKRRLKRCNDKRFMRTNEFLVGGVFVVTVVNILLAAFTTTDGRK